MVVKEMSQIYLLRHTETVKQNRRIYLGQRDIGLSEIGIINADKLVDYFSEIEIDRVIHTGLSRTKYLADQIADSHDLSSIENSALIEIDMGDWELRDMDEIQINYPDLYEARGQNLGTFKPQNGECFRELYERALPAFFEIAKMTQTEKGATVIVSHAGVNRVILSHFLKIDIDKILTIPQPYGAINLFETNDDSLNFHGMQTLKNIF